jgi:GT2 family glycosyltransferase
MRTIYISILNWNKAGSTLHCLDSLIRMNRSDDFSVKIFVTDNGSEQADRLILADGTKSSPISLTYLENNLGFTGGHNFILEKAIEDDIDYVWLVNNDGSAFPDTLAHLVTLAETDSSCGAVSPICFDDDSETVEFCGAHYDWAKLESVFHKQIIDSNHVNVSDKNSWITGTAILLRVKAIKEVGLLDDRFFAYFEDNDISARLAAAGWITRVAVNAHFKHTKSDKRQPYYYYLMARNRFLFFKRHTPKQYRKFIALRLMMHCLYTANGLKFNSNSNASVNACLLGGIDGLTGKGGRPDFSSRHVPWVILLFQRLIWPYHRHHLANKDNITPIVSS